MELIHGLSDVMRHYQRHPRIHSVALRSGNESLVHIAHSLTVLQPPSCFLTLLISSEALTLLPLAYRLKCYQREEIVDKRKKGT